ncbi:uncharacterized protein [Heliangelus exortis]|uniref:uncharacterized protein isoform X2 n=1 Tax=Heliangelus exortis TaxID=472823 RepID=UPI003A94D5F1
MRLRLPAPGSSPAASRPPEKPGICPLLTEEPLATVAPCGPSCAGDRQCPGAQKCCRSRCGHICVAPEPDKPGECPKVKPLQPPELCTEQDSCVHDRDCPRQEKCCFSGCAMRCARPAREHPGECPRAEPCWDPRRRRGSRCLDDSVCQQEEKCCGTGCGWDCVPVPRERWDGAGGHCAEECEADAQCPWGQRCTSTGCGRVCMDIPGAGCSPFRQSGSVSRPQGGGDLPGPLQPGRGVSLGPQVLQQRLWTRLHTCLSAGDEYARPQLGAALVTVPSCPQSVRPCLWPSRVPCRAGRLARLTRSVPGDRGAPAPAVAASAQTFLEAEWECAPSPGAVGHAWTSAAWTRTVPGATSAAAMAVDMSAPRCPVVRGPRATKPGPAPQLALGHLCVPARPVSREQPSARFWFWLGMAAGTPLLLLWGTQSRRDVEQDEALGKLAVLSCAWLLCPCPHSLGAP